MLVGKEGRPSNSSAVLGPWDPVPRGSYSTRLLKGSIHRGGRRAHGRLPLNILSDTTKLCGLETNPLQPHTALKTNLDEHFIRAGECQRLFTKKLKELFRVTCDPLYHSFSKAPPCSHPTPVAPGDTQGLAGVGGPLC